MTLPDIIKINCCGCRKILPAHSMVQMPNASLWVCRDCVVELNCRYARRARQQKWAKR